MAEVISLQLSQGGSTPTCHRPQCGEPTDHELVPHCADARQLAQPQAVSRGFGVVKPLQSRLPSSENLLEESKPSLFLQRCRCLPMLLEVHLWPRRPLNKQGATG